jgi:hypothetical protein
MGKPHVIRSVNGILVLAPLMFGLLLVEDPFERLGEWKPLYQGWSNWIFRFANQGGLQGMPFASN